MLQANYYEPCGLPYHNDKAVFDLISPETEQVFYYCTNCEIEVKSIIISNGTLICWVERKHED